jgi:RNA polymerase sigma factor FliA
MTRALAAYGRAPETDGELVARFATTLDRLARRCASRTGGAVASDDLWSAGALGLLDAAGRFDAAKGVRFETFAEHRIRGAMIDELRRLDHLPRRLREKTDSTAIARKALATELGRQPSNEEIAEKLGISCEEVDALEALSQPILPLDPEVQIVAEQPSQHDVFESRENAGRLAEAIATLPERLRTVLGLHYVEGLTYREIAGILQVSEPRVCQLHSEAVGKLRGILQEN